MVMQFMLSDLGLPNRETQYCKAQAKPVRTKRRALICLLLLAYMIVANIGYNLWAKGGKTPIRKIFTANIIYNLWTTKKTNATKVGTVVGILHNAENPCALINRELVHEGDVIKDIKVVRIEKHEVEFEKNGQRWTQEILAKPNAAWEKAK